MAFTKLNNHINKITYGNALKETLNFNDQNHKSFLNIFYMNIRSFNKNNSELRIFLNSFKFKFDIIVLVEIWANFEYSTDKIFEGYNLFYVTNTFNKNGGVAIYSLKELLTFTLDFNDCLNLDDKKNLDIIGLNISINKQNYAVIGLYNHNSNKIDSFKDTLLKVKSKFSKDKKIIVACDLNINLLNYGVINSVTNFVDALVDDNITFIVETPTRNFKNSSTLIDNFLLNGLNDGNDITYSNLDCRITDHSALTLKISSTEKKFFDNLIFKIRPFNKILISKFNAGFKKNFLITETVSALKRFLKLDTNVDLLSPHFDFDVIAKKMIVNETNVNQIFIIFHSILIKIQNRWFPIVVKKHKQSNNSNWFNDEIKNLIKIKNKHYKNWMKYGHLNPNLKYLYTQAKNECTKIIRKAKNDFLHKKISNLKDSRAKWKFLKKVFKVENQENTRIHEIVHNNIRYENHKDKADIFNKEYTTGIMDKLLLNFSHYNENVKGKLVSLSKNISEISEPNFTKLLKFEATNKSEVYNQIRRLKNKSNSIESELCNSFIKVLNNEISTIFSFYINFFYYFSIIPTELKKAVVIPRFKKGCKTQLLNYRPITNISVLAKILERNMLNRVIKLVSLNNLIDKNQFAYQNNISVDDAILQKTDFIYKTLNNNKSVLAVYLDFTRAFETINHLILLKKLEKNGFCEKSLLLIENYLSNRIQTTLINDIVSEPCVLGIGVPQGTILGPWLFIIFLNDIFKICKLANPVCFADDLLLLYEMDKNSEECPIEITNSLTTFGNWIDSNLLLINTEKTVFMTYSLNNKMNLNGNNFRVQLGSKGIKQVSSIKYLGLTFDRGLNFKLQVNILVNRLRLYSKYAFYLCKVLNTHIKLLWYHAYVNSYLASNCITLRTIGKNLITKIRAHQFKLIRILFRSEIYIFNYNNIGQTSINNYNKTPAYRLPSNELLRKFMENFSLLTYHQISLYHFIKFILKQRYLFLNHNVNRFSIGFKVSQTFNSENTNNIELNKNRNDRLTLPFYKMKMGQRSINYNAANSLNCLKIDLDALSNYPNKTSLKMFILKLNFHD